MILAVVCLLCVAMATAEEETTYPTTWDNVNLDDILDNKRLVNSYMKCLLGQGKCSPDGVALKKFLPDALKTNCSKCSEKQRQGGIRVFLILSEEKPKLWKEVVEKYDPDGAYLNAFQSNLYENTTEI